MRKAAFAVTLPPKTRIGPAMETAELIVTAEALPDLPRVRPVSVEAKLKDAVKPEVKLAVEGSTITVPAPANPEVVGGTSRRKTIPPASTVVTPVKVAAPVRIRLLAAACVTPPDPLMAPANVNSSERSKASTDCVTTLPASVPEVPPAPTRKVPAVTVVPPVWLTAPLSTVTPEPSCSKEPVPEIALATVRVPVRLKTRAPLFVIAPAPGVPVPPPAPIRTVPPEIRVVPVLALAPLRESVPPVALRVTAPEPERAPLRTVLRAESTREPAPVLVKVCSVRPAAPAVPAETVPPVPAEAPR